MPYTKSFPRIDCDFFHCWFQLRQSQEVHVAILLLVVSVLAGGQLVCIERVVMGGFAVDGRIFLIAVRLDKVSACNCPSIFQGCVRGNVVA